MIIFATVEEAKRHLKVINKLIDKVRSLLSDSPKKSKGKKEFMRDPSIDTRVEIMELAKKIRDFLFVCTIKITKNNGSAIFEEGKEGDSLLENSKYSMEIPCDISNEIIENNKNTISEERYRFFEDPLEVPNYIPNKITENNGNTIFSGNDFYKTFDEIFTKWKKFLGGHTTMEFYEPIMLNFEKFTKAAYECDNYSNWSSKLEELLQKTKEIIAQRDRNKRLLDRYEKYCANASEEYYGNFRVTLLDQEYEPPKKRRKIDGDYYGSDDKMDSTSNYTPYDVRFTYFT